MDNKDNINYNVIPNKITKKKKKRKKKKNAARESERNEAVIAMKNNIRQFWNDLPSSKRKELINMEKENVLKRLSKAPDGENDIGFFYNMYYEELEKFLKDDENCRNEFFSTDSDKFFKNNENIHEKDIMPLIEESLLDEQKFNELAKKINRKNYSIDSGEDEDIDEEYQNSITSDEKESELKEIEEDEDIENDNKEEIESIQMKQVNQVFHVISIRMFEHKILQAYKNHIAYLNQQRLFKELEQEKLIIDEKEKNRAKKNEKKRLKKQIDKLKKSTKCRG